MAKRKSNKRNNHNPTAGKTDAAGQSTKSCIPEKTASVFALPTCDLYTKAVLEKFGFSQSTAVQQACMPLMIERHQDVVVQAPTGSGKTLAFVIPIFKLVHRYLGERQKTGTNVAGSRRPILACIICPTQELAQQIYDVVMQFERFAAPNATATIRTAIWVGGHNIKEEIDSFVKNGAPQIVVATPGRIRDLLTRDDDEVGEAIRTAMRCLEILVFDEADRLLDMGFRYAIDVVLSIVPKQRRTALFSATQTKSVEDLIRVGMRNPTFINISSQGSAVIPPLPSSTNKSNNSKQQHHVVASATPEQLINYFKIISPYEKFAVLVDFLRQRTNEKHIVFVATCAFATYLSMLLSTGLIPDPAFHCFILHRKLKHKRKNIFKQFSEAKCGVLIATDIVARGIDWPDINWVIQLDAPKTPSSFVHRCGRTARLGGLVGSSLLFLMPNEEGYVSFIQKNQNVQLVEAQWLTLPDARQIAETLKGFRRAVSADREVLDASVMAFTSFVRAYGKHECALLCQVKELDLISLAIGMGLVTLPVMPELRGRDKSDFELTIGNFEPSTVPYKNKKLQQKYLERKTPQAHQVCLREVLSQAAVAGDDDDDETEDVVDAVSSSKKGGSQGKRKWNQQWSQAQDMRERRQKRKLITKLKAASNTTKLDSKQKYAVRDNDCDDADDDDDDEDALAARIVELKQKRSRFLQATKPERLKKKAKQSLLDK